MKSIFTSGVAAAAITCALPTIASATTYDAAADFSSTLNPNGAWSFGYQPTTVGFGFTRATLSGNYLGVDYWQMGPTVADLPGAFHNPSQVSNVNYGTAIFDPGMLILHPGQTGQFALARFTVPTTGSYQFSTTFIGQDRAIGTTTDVYMLVNNVQRFNGFINGFHVTASSGTFTMTLQANDTIDAAVGFGTNGNYYGDSTGLDFRVQAVPTPGAAALLGLGGLIATRRRRS